MRILTKRITAMLLAGMLVIGSVPGSVFAASTDVDTGQTSEIAEEVYDEESSEAPEASGDMSQVGETSEGPVGAGETTQVEETSEAPAGEGEMAEIEETSEAPVAVGETAESGDTSEAPLAEEEATVQYYTVTLDANGGYFENEWDDSIGDYTQQAEVVEKQVPVDGTVAAFPVHKTEADGQTMLFAGWSLERDGELVSQEEEEYTPVDNCVLYAVWEVDDCSAADEEASEFSAEDPVCEDTDNQDGESSDTDNQDTVVVDESTDLTEETVTDSISYESESANYELFGDAAIASDDGRLIQLTPLDFWQIGAAWINDKYCTKDGLTVTYSFWAGGGHDNWAGGADGIVLMFSETKGMGEVGGALGYIPGTVGVELDSYYYEGDEIGGKHVAIISEEEHNHLAYKIDNRVDDEQWHDMIITYSDGTMSVYMDKEYVLEAEVSLPDFVYIGASASTGNGYNQQLIKDLAVSGGTDYSGNNSEQPDDDIDTYIIDSGECGADGDNVTWTLDNNGVLLISGSGRIRDYSIENPSPFFNDKRIVQVDISGNITNIGDCLFERCSSLSSITIPDSVTAVGSYAFSNSGLTSIELPEGTASVGEHAFSGCSHLETASLGNTMTQLQTGTFAGCQSLTDVILPDSLTSVGPRAFANCTSSMKIEVNSTILYWGLECFDSATDIVLIVNHKYNLDDDEWESWNEFCLRLDDLSDIYENVCWRQNTDPLEQVQLTPGQINLTLVANTNDKNDHGHTFLVLHNNTAEDIYLGSYKVKPDSSCAIGARGHGVWIDYDSYHQDTFRDFTFLTTVITKSDLSTLERVLRENSDFNFLTHNCTTVGVAAWNSVVDDIHFDEKGIDLPSQTKKEIRHYPGYGCGHSLLAAGLAREGLHPWDVFNYTKKGALLPLCLKEIPGAASVIDRGFTSATIECGGIPVEWYEPTGRTYVNGWSVSWKEYSSLEDGTGFPPENHQYIDDLSKTTTLITGLDPSKSYIVCVSCCHITDETESEDKRYIISEKSLDIVFSTLERTLTLSPQKKVLAVGDKYGLTAKCNDPDAHLQWTSSSNNIVTVSNTGSLLAKKEGNAKIKVSTGTQEQTCSVSVEKPIITAPGELTEGKTAVAALKRKTGGSLISDVTWGIEKNNGNIALDSKGKITALKEGNAVITATRNGILIGKKTIKILPEASIALSPSSKTLFVGQSFSIKATVKGKSKNVIWKSSKTGIAAVIKGKVTAKAAGSAVITATANKKSASVKVTVKKPTIKLSRNSLKLANGEKFTLKATVNGPSKKVSWKSSNSSIASVSSNGVITAKKNGSVTITATANKVSAKCTIKIVNPWIKLDKSSLKMNDEAKYTLKATVRGKSKKVTWKSSDSSIASVSSNGVVRAKKKGTVTVIATANKVSAKCVITVVQSSIKLNRKSLTLVEGTSGKLTATVKGLSKVVVWSSSNSAVAVVSGGKITAKKEGTATIAAKANGKTAYCKITVKAKEDTSRVNLLSLMGKPFSDVCSKVSRIQKDEGSIVKTGKSFAGYYYMERDFYNYNTMEDLGNITVDVINYHTAVSETSSPVNYIKHTYVDLGSYDDRSPFAVEGIYVGFNYYQVSGIMTGRGWKELYHSSLYCIFEKGNYLVAFEKGRKSVSTICIIDKRVYPSGYNYKTNFEKDLLPNI